MKKIKLHKDEEEIVLNPEHLEFNNANLNDFLQKSPGWYAYYSEKHSLAQFYSSAYEDRYENIYSAKFKSYKLEGGSDKLAEASARSDEDTINAQKDVRKAKENQNLIGGFVKSLDKAMQNALNLGYNIRKEMDKLSGSHSIKSLDEILGN